LTRTWGGSAIGGDIVLELTPSFFFNFNYDTVKNNSQFFLFIKKNNI
jgi:hypothetical protein